MILGHGDKVVQEFYCRHCPADDPHSKDPEKRRTGGHFRVRFNLGYDASIKIQCPNCGHQHDRHVKNGVLFDGAGTSAYKDEVKVPKSAWSREPFTKKAEALRKYQPDEYLSPVRGDNVIASEADLSDAAKAALKKKAARRGGTVLQIHDPDAGADGPAAGDGAEPGSPT